MSSTALVSVIIPTWRRAEILSHTLKALLCEDLDLEVVVVCDGEDAPTRELSQQCSDQRVRWIFHQKNLGPSAARNTGAQKATGELLLFLDDDMEITPGLLRLHTEAHKASTNLAVQGRIVENSRIKQKSHTGTFLEQGWMKTLEAFAEANWSNDGLQIPTDAALTTSFGTNCSIRRDVFLEAGGFDTRLHTTDEDMEFGHRLYMHGVRFQLEPQVVAFHRNTKDLVPYYLACWETSGHLDVLRAMRLGQKNAQTCKLIAMDSGPYLSRLVHRAVWHNTGAASAAANALERFSEMTGSRLSFRLWHEISSLHKYWHAVKQEGATREELRALAPNPVRVLLLHSIAAPLNAAEKTYYLSPARFRRLLDALRAEQYRSVEPEALQRDFWGPKDFLLTFDDGYDDFYTEVFPLCAEYQLKPLVFLPAAYIGGSNVWDQRRGLRARNLLTKEQVREMQKHGVRFGSHTMTHPSLPGLNDCQLKAELCDSKKMLEDLLGTEVSTLAYPSGEANRRVRAAVIEAGYKQAFSTKPGWNTWEDPFDIHRTEINETDAVSSYAMKLARGLNTREAIMYEVRPLIQLIPGDLRRKLRRVRESVRQL
jgi:GT2 family glycosyltransferase/peptidoglycan/xylan/chitin deacetylase (PgdA/CDA1 family)